jgi:hypothetical protein
MSGAAVSGIARNELLALVVVEGVLNSKRQSAYDPARVARGPRKPLKTRASRGVYDKYTAFNKSQLSASCATAIVTG